MKQFLNAILVRLGIGAGIAVIGIGAALVSGNWNVDFIWFQVIGIVCIVVAILPYFQWTRRAYTKTDQVRLSAFDSGMNTAGGGASKSRHSRDFLNTANVTVSFLLIGLVNVIVPYLVRYFVVNTGVSNAASKATAAVKLTGNANPSGSAALTSSRTNHKNGTIISMKKVSIQGQNPKIQLYKMLYWSEGQKVEAMVSEPKHPRAYQYALVVSCHGGYVTSQNVQHAKSPETWQAVAHNSSSFITIAPQYRGYAQSGGTVHGLLGDTIDTENAIAAADSLKQVNDQYMQVWGTSMGGGVALMIASNPKYVGSLTAVVATSPFVGWDVVGEYAMKHPADKRDNQLLSIGDKTYGNFSVRASAYKKRSLDI